jgi:hypothetical protein
MKSVNSILVPLIFTLILLMPGCVKTLSDDKGILEGTIYIGPICPVETDPPSSDCLPTAETYKAYPVGVWNSDGTLKIADINPSLDGSFILSLAPGQYLVKLGKETTIGGSNLPMHVTVIAIEKTVISVNIDTGIR